MKVLVTGASGQLGREVVDVFTGDDNGHEVIALDRGTLDIGREADVMAAVRDHEPHLIINCAAMTNVDACEAEPDAAHHINALGPWWLARACALVDATLLHVSTDYVFSGQMRATPAGEPRAWTEFDPCAPSTVYGASKLAGEQLVRETLAKHHIVRTSWVFGQYGSNFVKTMLRVGREHGKAKVVDDQIGSPTSAADLARAIREVAVSGRYGTVHRSNSGSCSWYDFTRAIYAHAGMTDSVELRPCTTAQFPLPAPRPAYSVLSNRHAELAGFTPMRAWQDALHDVMDQVQA